MPNIFAGPEQTAGIDRTLSQSIMQNPPPMRRPRGLFPQMMDAAGYEFDPSVITNAISALPQLDLWNGEIPNPGTFGIYSPLDPRAEQNRIPSHLFPQSLMGQQSSPLSPAALTSMVGPTQSPPVNRTLAQSVMQNPPPAPMQSAGQMPTPPPSGLIPGTDSGVRLPDNVAAGPWSRMTRRGPNGTLIAGDANSPWVQDVEMPGQSSASPAATAMGIAAPQDELTRRLWAFANSVNPQVGVSGNLDALGALRLLQQSAADRQTELARTRILADAQRNDPSLQILGSAAQMTPQQQAQLGLTPQILRSIAQNAVRNATPNETQQPTTPSEVTLPTPAAPEATPQAIADAINSLAAEDVPRAMPALIAQFGREALRRFLERPAVDLFRPSPIGRAQSRLLPPLQGRTFMSPDNRQARIEELIGR